jgi:two-component system LytT family response regulator
LFYVLWSILYFQLDGRPLLGPKPKGDNDFIDRISLDDRGQVKTVPIGDVECFSASGDYVEVHLANQSFLKKETILNLEALLDPAQFARVHRSTIVNRARVKSIAARGSGAYELTLESGQVVNASRSYRPVVLELQSQA